MFFFIAFMIGLGAGASVLIGQAWGAGKVERVRAVAGTTLAVGLAFGLVVAVLGGSFTGTMLRALGTPSDILPDATQYARIILSPCRACSCSCWPPPCCGVGDTVTPLYTLLISAGIGLVLTPALIRGWAGLPQLGVASGAAATVVSFVVATTWLGWRLRRLHSPLAPGRALAAHLRVLIGVCCVVLRVGVPTGCSSSSSRSPKLPCWVWSMATVPKATAAYGAVNQVVAYVQFPPPSRSRSRHPFWVHRPLAPGACIPWVPSCARRCG